MSNENPENQKPNNNLNKQDILNYKEPNLNTSPKISPWTDIVLGLGLSVLLIIAMVATSILEKRE